MEIDRMGCDDCWLVICDEASKTYKCMTRGIDTYKLPVMDDENIKAFHRNYNSCNCTEANN